MLLAAAADGENFAESDAIRLHGGENLVQRVGPEQRRTVLHQRVTMRQHAVLRFVTGQCAVEVQGFFVNHLARVEVNDDGAEALGAGIESEK